MSIVPSPEPRRRAFQLDREILRYLRTIGPSTAYDLVRELQEPDRRLIPAMVYRSLSRLIIAERVIRVEVLKVFCEAPSTPSIALICSGCDSISLLPCQTMLEAISDHARTQRFAAGRLVIELLGLCPKCRSRDDSSRSEEDFARLEGIDNQAVDTM